MRYMVVERFGDAAGIYRRLRERGRLMPEGLVYVDSWISSDLTRCFQLMETDDRGLFEAWVANWSDLMDFEIVPVVSSAEASARALAGSDPQSASSPGAATSTRSRPSKGGA